MSIPVAVMDGKFKEVTTWVLPLFKKC